MVQAVGNQLLPIEGKGNVNLTSEGEINMNEVYFVPGLSFNLLSAGSITNMGFILVFGNKGCTIYQDKKIVGRDVRDGKTSLYGHLMFQPAFKICAVTSIFVAQLWHRQLKKVSIRFHFSYFRSHASSSTFMLYETVTMQSFIRDSDSSFGSPA